MNAQRLFWQARGDYAPDLDVRGRRAVWLSAVEAGVGGLPRLRCVAPAKDDPTLAASFDEALSRHVWFVARQHPLTLL